MSEVVLNEAAIERFFHSETGPLARLVARKAAEIKAHAANFAPFRDGGLIVGLHVQGPFQDPDAFFMLVGSDAVAPWRGHEDFNYPIAQELGGVTPQGVPYRNPFLIPGVIAAGFQPV